MASDSSQQGSGAVDAAFDRRLAPPTFPQFEELFRLCNQGKITGRDMAWFLSGAWREEGMQHDLSPGVVVEQATGTNLAVIAASELRDPARLFVVSPDSVPVCSWSLLQKRQWDKASERWVPASWDGADDSQVRIVDAETLATVLTPGVTDVLMSSLRFDRKSAEALRNGSTPACSLVSQGDFRIQFKGGNSTDVTYSINQAAEIIAVLHEVYGIPVDAIVAYADTETLAVAVDAGVFGIPDGAGVISLQRIYATMTEELLVTAQKNKPNSPGGFANVLRQDSKEAVNWVVPANSRLSGPGGAGHGIRLSCAAFGKMTFSRLHDMVVKGQSLTERAPWSKTVPKAKEWFDRAASAIETQDVSTVPAVATAESA
jgi:hypothetical protein